MKKRKVSSLLIVLLLPMILEGQCLCKKDKDHKHKSGTTICEVCNHECDCKTTPIDPNFGNDPGDHW